jgi:ribosomal protein S18 acetylase RimI-like enzyme
MRQLNEIKITTSYQLVPFSTDTLDTVSSIVQDQAQYLHCGVDGVEPMLARFLQQSNDELTPWLIVDRDDNPVAFAGFYKKPTQDVHSFLIVVNSEFQGKGIGYRVASSLVKYAFNEGLLSYFRARLRIENQASLKLLTKLGMKVFNNPILNGCYFLEMELSQTDFALDCQ